MVNDKQNKGRRIINLIIFGIQFVLSCILIGALFINQDMIPSKYIYAASGAVIILDIIVCLLMFIGLKKAQFSGMLVRRIIAIVLIIATGVVSIIGAHALTSANTAIKEITSERSNYQALNVYALKESGFEAVADLSGKKIGYVKKYDVESTEAVFEDMARDGAADLQTVGFDSPISAAKALYGFEIDAMMIFSGFESIIEDQKEFLDFNDRTVIVYEHELLTEKKETAQQTVKEQEETDVKKPFIVYLSGSDSRSNVLSVSRSDVNILACVNPEKQEILLVNTPRDYYVDISIAKGHKDKLTHCGIYGVECSMDTLADLYDIKIDHYVQINFTGFKALIDMLGGIDVESDVEFSGGNGGVDIKKGMNHLNGEQALGFARERYQLQGGDNDRGQNQMKIIKALISQMDVKTLATQYSEMLKAVSGMFATDMSSGEISELIKMQVEKNIKWKVTNCAVTGTGASEKTFSAPDTRAYVMVPDQKVVDDVKLKIKVFMGEVEAQ